VATAFAASTAPAHHSNAEFDVRQTGSVEGVVTRYDWTNPHVYIFIEQTAEDGSTTEWEIEAYPPASMRRLGWSPDAIAVGDRIQVSGSPSRRVGANRLLLTGMARSDTTLFDTASAAPRLLAGGGTPAEATAKGLDGVWATRLAFLGFGQPAQRFQLTDAGRAAVEAYDDPTMNPAADCVPLSSPILMFAMDTKRIVIEEDVVRIAADWDPVERIVHMDKTSHDGAAPSVQGHSIGRWEGENLVIETAQFAEHRAGNGVGLPSGAQKRLVERLTLAADGKSLTYWFELSDPEYLAAPVTGEVLWDYRPDLELAPVACELESARRFIPD
jgi:hypothetical protein